MAALGAFALGYRLSVAAFFGLIAGGLVSIALYYWEKQQGRAPDEATERMIAALVEGGKGCVGIAATCATAGIIVSIINLSGLGLKLSGLIVDLGGGSLPVTILLAAFAMWILGDRDPGDRLLHHRRRDPGAGARVARRAAARGAYVHVLLCRAGGRLAADRARPLRGFGDLRRLALPHHDAGMEIHAAGLCRAGDVLPVAAGRGLAVFYGDWWSIILIPLTSTIALAGFAIAAAGWIVIGATPLERLLAAVSGCALMAPHPDWQAGGIVSWRRRSACTWRACGWRPRLHNLSKGVFSSPLDRNRR